MHGWPLSFPVETNVISREHGLDGYCCCLCTSSDCCNAVLVFCKRQGLTLFSKCSSNSAADSLALALRFAENSPCRLWNNKPSANGKRSAETGVEKGRFQAPVPLVFVEHVGYQDVHDDASDTRYCGSETGRVGAESLGGDFADKSPPGGARALKADNYMSVKRVSLQKNQSY